MLTHSHLFEFGVLCEKCGQRTPKSIAWLIVRNNMPSGNCGALIDLTAGYNTAVIQKTAQHCAELDAMASKRDDIA